MFNQNTHAVAIKLITRHNYDYLKLYLYANIIMLIKASIKAQRISILSVCSILVYFRCFWTDFENCPQGARN